MAQKKKVDAKAKSKTSLAAASSKASPKVAAASSAKSATKSAPPKPSSKAAKAKTPVVAKQVVAKQAGQPAKSTVAAPAVARAKVSAKMPAKPVAKAATRIADVKPPVKAAVAPARVAPAAVAVKLPISPATLAVRAATNAQASAGRAVPANVNKPAEQRISSPVPSPSAAPSTPKALAEKAAQQRQMISAQKKTVSQRHGFKTNEFIVYPAHGVGRITGIEEQEIAGMSLELFVITFDKEKLTLRVPTGKLATVGMRKLADEDVVKRAMETLRGRARVKRTMWSRRAQEYVAKINSGDLIQIAEVVRDLFRSEAQPEQSYSERQLYEDALDRMAREIAAVDKLDERGAVQRIVEVLSKSAKGRRLTEAGTPAPAEDGEVQAA